MWNMSDWDVRVRGNLSNARLRDNGPGIKCRVDTTPGDYVTLVLIHGFEPVSRFDGRAMFEHTNKIMGRVGVQTASGSYYARFYLPAGEEGEGGTPVDVVGEVMVPGLGGALTTGVIATVDDRSVHDYSIRFLSGQVEFSIDGGLPVVASADAVGVSWRPMIEIVTVGATLSSADLESASLS